MRPTLKCKKKTHKCIKTKFFEKNYQLTTKETPLTLSIIKSL